MRIMTNKNYKKVVKAKIGEKICASLALANAVIIAFSGCESLARDKMNHPDESSVPSTTHVDKFTGTTSIDEIDEFIEEVPTTESKTTEVQATIPQSTLEETTENRTDDMHDQLLKELNQVIEDRSFGSEANELILETFEDLYKNFDGWRVVYPELPNKKPYIENKFILPLREYVDKITVCDVDTDKAKEIELQRTWLICNTRNGDMSYKR